MKWKHIVNVKTTEKTHNILSLIKADLLVFCFLAENYNLVRCFWSESPVTTWREVSVWTPILLSHIWGTSSLLGWCIKVSSIKGDFAHCSRLQVTGTGKQKRRGNSVEILRIQNQVSWFLRKSKGKQHSNSWLKSAVRDVLTSDFKCSLPLFYLQLCIPIILQLS